MDPCLSTTIFKPKGEEGLPLEPTLAPIRDAGFRWIEISRKHHGITHCAERIRRAGLQVWSIHGALGGGTLSTQASERRAALEAEVRRMEDAAPFAPCPYVIHYLDRRTDRSVGERWRGCVQDLLAHAERLGFNVAVESTPYKPEVDERFATSAEVAEFVRGLRSDFASVCLDLNHSNLQEDLVDVARNFHGLISNIHVSDNHGHREEHLLPGEGTINLPKALRAIVAARYDGPCNLECHTPGLPTPDDLVGLRAWAEGVEVH